MTDNSLKAFLDKKAETYDQPFFIQEDPIYVPHLFSRKEDIEIAGFFAAVFAWGNRTTIIRKASELMDRMDRVPYDFCLHATPQQLKGLLGFKHRTFNDTDLLYFVEFFRYHYSQHKSLECAFTMHGSDMETRLIGFHHYFFSLEHVPQRSRKHIASPEKGSTCKRINMFLRWMVRSNTNGVDFGIWKNISPADLICPIDIHVARVAKKLGLLTRKAVDWNAAIELTNRLKEMDPLDPVKYDFALFALGAAERH
ncbi:MAG: TIGR02757 family protein [Chitinophagaceae bacterium]